MQLSRPAPAGGPGRPAVGAFLAACYFACVDVREALRRLGGVKLLLGGGEAIPDQNFDGVGG